MSRMSNFRYSRSLNVTNLKQYSEEVFEPEGHSPQGLVQILTRRAIFIH